MDVYARLKHLAIELPPPPAPGGNYRPVVKTGQDGKLCYTAGVGCKKDGVCVSIGRAGKEATLDQAKAAARQCILNLLSLIQSEIEDLNEIKQFVKMLGFIASDESFHDQPKVLDAASNLLEEIFGGKAGKPARAAIGTNVLPNDQTVEIELIFELK